MNQVNTQLVVSVLAQMMPNHTLISDCLLGSGVSAQVIGVETRSTSNVTHRHAVRLEIDENDDSGEIINHQLINYLYAQELPVPRSYASARMQGYHVSIMDWLPGHSAEQVQDTLQAAQAAAKLLFDLHQISLIEPPLELVSALPEYRFDYRAIPRDRLPDAAYQKIVPLARRHQPKVQRQALLHGDYWPGNLLVEDGHISGLIDWRDACVGDPLADLANARYEIAWLWGISAMREFTQAYWGYADDDARYGPLPNEHEYRASIVNWDLHAVLKPLGRMHLWGLDEPARKRLVETVDIIVAEATASKLGV